MQFEFCSETTTQYSIARTVQRDETPSDPYLLKLLRARGSLTLCEDISDANVVHAFILLVGRTVPAMASVTRLYSLSLISVDLKLGRGAPLVWRALQRSLESLPHLEALALDAHGAQLSWVFTCAPSLHLRNL